METVQNKSSSFSVEIPNYLIESNLVQKFLRYLEFQEIVKDSQMNENESWKLSEEIKQEWWDKNKDWFLKGIKT